MLTTVSIIHRRIKLFQAIMPALFLLGITVSTAFADLKNSDDKEQAEESSANGQQRITERHQTATIQSGYRFVTPNPPTQYADPYTRLKSGVTGAFSAATLSSDLKLLVDGQFLHEDDYHAELLFDYSGLLRIHAESGALWHNLPSERINPGTLSLREFNSDKQLGIRTATTQADTRIKLGNNPFHLNLGYWELTRDGYEQIKFSDHSFGAAPGTMISDVSRVDRVTREGNIGLDAHLGVLDISYGFRIRDFVNRAPDNRYQFENTGGGALAPGYQAYAVIPDNRVTSHSVKLFSDLSGGLVASAGYNLTMRENNGGHGDALPSTRPSDTLQNVAGDVSYTPGKMLSFALKYRHQEIDRTTPATIYYPYSRIPDPAPAVYTASTGTLLVAPSINSMRDSLTFSTIIRPAPQLICRLEYQGDLESRDNVRDQGAAAGSPSSFHSDRRQTHTGKASLYWKPVKDLKFNASYSFAATDNPSYGASFSTRHILQTLLTYSQGGRWGITGSYLAQFESGESPASTALPASVAQYSLPRESRNSSANLSFWFAPLQNLTITPRYSYLEANVDQTMLFASIIADSNPLLGTNYLATSHVYGVDVVYAVTPALDLSAAFQQALSVSRFQVPFRSFTIAGTTTGTYDTADITGLSRLDSTETAVSARADWRFTAHLGTALEYGYQVYNAGNPATDGDAHVTMISLKARW